MALKAAEKVMPVRTHLHLIDPGYLVFNGILYGDDLSVWLVDRVQAE